VYFQMADIYLDSTPFSGTTSLIEPLEVGLPIVSYQGQYFRSAMGAAILKSLDLHDLVGASFEEYIQKAIALGTNEQFRAQIKHQVRVAMSQKPTVLDSRIYAAQIGDLFNKLFMDKLSQSLCEILRLRAINLIAFPDWQQSEDRLLKDLMELVWAIAHHPNQESMTLLLVLDGTVVDAEGASLALSSVAMNLMMEDDDTTAYEELEISLVEELGPAQWQVLFHQIQGRIILKKENQDVIAAANAYNLPASKIETLATLFC
ncbi:MAG: hypothetical protein F6K09_17435, partial [Merismopedia sp. SIO2A8]|nr:hypothetical protein [Merismopedia sp. SIO2A8]